MFKTVISILTLAALTLNPYVQIEQLEQSRVLGNGRLASMLSSNDRQVALRAALAIGRTKQPAGVALLRPRATADDPAMRAMAVYAIGLIGGAQAVPLILRALGDREDIVRVAALDAVTRLLNAKSLSPAQSKSAIGDLRGLLESRSPVVRARTATALAAFAEGSESSSAQALLAGAFGREADAVVRWHIMWSLYRGYAKTAPRGVLAAGLRDKDEVVRIEAVRAFGRRDNPADAAALRPLTGDTSWRVQEQTLESLKVLRGGKPSEHLTRIPAGIHTPAPQSDSLASLPALARTPVSGKPKPPVADRIALRPQLQASTVSQFTGPSAGPHPRARIVTTAGNIYVELYPEWAPLTVENFLNLANEGYYDNNPWFRIVPDFVVQSGDPSADAPGPGYTIPAEENPIEQDSYVISMGLDYTNPPNAHAKRDSAASEFYITLSPQLHLNSDFTVFGRVISGFDVLGRLVESDKILRIERIPDSRS